MNFGLKHVLMTGLSAIVVIVVLKVILNKYQVPYLTDTINAV